MFLSLALVIPLFFIRPNFLVWELRAVFLFLARNNCPTWFLFIAPLRICCDLSCIEKLFWHKSLKVITFGVLIQIEWPLLVLVIWLDFIGLWSTSSSNSFLYSAISWEIDFRFMVILAFGGMLDPTGGGSTLWILEVGSLASYFFDLFFLHF